jgi:hypothetical protein
VRIRNVDVSSTPIDLPQDTGNSGGTSIGGVSWAAARRVVSVGG